MSSENDDLVFLANVVRQREEKKATQHAFNAAKPCSRRRRVLNVTVLLLQLISQLNNITVPGLLLSFRRAECWMVGEGMQHIFRRAVQENVSSVEINI